MTTAGKGRGGSHLRCPYPLARAPDAARLRPALGVDPLVPRALDELLDGGDGGERRGEVLRAGASGAGEVGDEHLDVAVAAEAACPGIGDRVSGRASIMVDVDEERGRTWFLGHAFFSQLGDVERVRAAEVGFRRRRALLQNLLQNRYDAWNQGDVSVSDLSGKKERSWTYPRRCAAASPVG